MHPQCQQISWIGEWHEGEGHEAVQQHDRRGHRDGGEISRETNNHPPDQTDSVGFNFAIYILASAASCVT